MIIGLTGGIASGKSTAAQFLEEFGAYIIDADYISHQITKKGQPGWQAVVSHFGREMLKENEEINRKKLGKLVFNNDKAREELEALLHPLINAQIKEKIAIGSATNQIVFLMAPLLYETNLDKLCDEVWVIDINQETQLERLKERDDISLEAAKKRINAQLPLQKKCEMADCVLKNNKQPADLRKQISKQWQRIKESL